MEKKLTFLLTLTTLLLRDRCSFTGMQLRAEMEILLDLFGPKASVTVEVINSGPHLGQNFDLTAYE